MIKTSIFPRRIKGIIILILSISFLSNNAFAQTVFNLPDYINNNTDGPTFYNETQSITGCTSIDVSFEFSSSLGWIGSGNMESFDECDFGDPCMGDPNDPLQGDCDECWDYLWFEFYVNGNLEIADFIGTTNLITSETYSYNTGCIDPSDQTDFELDGLAQTWASAETVSLENIIIICYDEVTELDVLIEPSNEVCEGDDVNLTLNPAYGDAEWEFGGVNFDSGLTSSIPSVTTGDAGTYTVIAYDVNGCSSSADFDIDVLPIPMACDVVTPIEPCSTLPSGEAEIDLTQYDSEANCFTSDDVIWFTDQGDIPDFPIIDPTTYQTFSGSVWAVVFNGTCYSDPVEVLIDVTAGLEPMIDIANDMLCEGQNIVFDIVNTPSCPDCDYDWEGPPTSGVTETTTTSQYSVINANTDFDGTWTVTVTDENGCTGSSSVIVNITSGPTGTISGGGDLCPGYCTDASNELTLDLSGGTPLYDATIEVSVGPISLPITLPAFLPNGSVSLCIDPAALLPSLSDFDGDGVDDLVIPDLALNFSIELMDLVDANGCSGVGSGIITYNIQNEPNANDPGGPYELCEGMLFDLTSYNVNINATEAILWFEDMALTMPIADPTMYQPGSTVVWAVVDNGTCLSDPVDLLLIEIVTPVLDPIADQEVCGQFDFNPPSGSNLGANVYYEDTDGNQYFAGDITMDSGMYTVFAGDNPLCMDMETFEITVLQEPEIIFPTMELSGCGEITLPEINANNLHPLNGSVLYSEGSNQTGMLFSENDVVAENQGITTLYVYAGNGPNCFQEIQIDLNFTSDIEYLLPAYPDIECGDFQLLDVGGATPGLAYYTELDGGGTEYLPGDFLEAPGTYTLYLYDLSIDQTCVLNSNESFSITLEEEPIIDPIDDVSVCESEGFILPEITGDFLTGDESYSTESNGGGMSFEPGDIVDFSTTIYMFNNQASCPAQEVVFEINVIPAPNAGDDNTIETCIGPPLDLSSFLSIDADLGGVFESDDAVLTGADLSIWDTNGAMTNQAFLFQYIVNSPGAICPPDTSEITISLTNDVSAGMAILDSTVCEGELIDLFDFLEGESSGGYFLDPASPLDTIFDGVWMADGSGTSFEYVIEAMDGCNGDQTDFMVAVTNMETIEVSMPDQQLCSGACVSMIFEASAPFNLDMQLVDTNFNVYDINLEVEGNQEFQVCLDGTVGDFDGETISLGQDAGNYILAFAFDPDPAPCYPNLSNLNDFNLTAETVFEETIIGEVCPGEAFEYNGEFYSQDQTLISFSLNGCDSITNIVVEEFPPAENFENDTYCIGTMVPIGGNIYTEDTNVQLMLEDASANGCDSIIYVDIKFDDASYNIIDKTICLEDSEMVGNEIYDVNNPMGSDTIIGGSVLGCDSIISVMLNFYDAALGEEVETICQGDTINILGENFYEGMDMLDIVLEGSSTNGCDSIVSVSVDFFPTMELDETYEKCEGDILEVNGYIITDENLDGFYTIENPSNDCPTIINYTTELLISSSTMIDTSICQGETVIINGIEFSETNTFDEMIIPSSNGCDSIITINVNIDGGATIITQQLIGNNTYQLDYESNGVMEPVWTSSTGLLECDTCETTSIMISEDTEIYLTAITESGCIVTDTILLSYLPEEIFVNIFYPNIFTPDDPNLNQIYTIYGTQGIMISELNIYDRWGNEVYSATDFLTNDESAAWNGRIDGEEALQGVYVGIVRYIDSQGVEQFEAFDFTLIR